VLASKGGTTTHDVTWRLDSLEKAEAIDMVIWDYGMNDMSMIVYHRDFVKGFFESVAFKFKNLSSFAVLYWNDESSGNKMFFTIRTLYIFFVDVVFLSAIFPSCNSTGEYKWTNDLPKLDYPILKKKFWEGSLKNFSLISMSLPNYCIAAKCSPNDFLAANTGHPNDIGVAFFSDLVIWQVFF
jgi:hypothetical protein